MSAPVVQFVNRLLSASKQKDVRIPAATEQSIVVVPLPSARQHEHVKGALVQVRLF